MNIKKHIPNFITCCNLLCGCLSIVKAFEGDLVAASYLIILGAVFDFFDGFAARLLKVSSLIGKDLDSLTDMVTFGVGPGILLFQMIKQGLSLDKEGFNLFEEFPYFIYFPFIIIIFSAIRLAKFNNDTRQTNSFIGVPTPAVAMFICSIPLMVHWNEEFSHEQYHHFVWLLNPYILCAIALIFSFLLVSELPLFALKFKNFKFVGNESRFVFLGVSAVLLILLHFFAVPLIILLYVLMSMIVNLQSKH